MAAITIALIQELRTRTNAGMMACKKALAKTNGDMEEAIKVLRENGQAIQVKRASKEVKQGLIATATAADGAISLTEVNCETDFVANTDGFKGFVAKAAQKAAEGVEDITAALKDDIGSLIASTGENMVIRRSERYVLSGTGKIESYIHMGGRIGVLVEIGAEKEETLAKPAFEEYVHDIALQIAGAGARWLDRTQVPADIVEAEMEVNRKKLEQEQIEKGAKPKPPEILKKIAQGQIGKFYTENCLVDQLFVKNAPGEKTTVTQLTNQVSKKLGDKLTIRRYARFQLGA